MSTLFNFNLGWCLLFLFLFIKNMYFVEKFDARDCIILAFLCLYNLIVFLYTIQRDKHNSDIEYLKEKIKKEGW